MQNLSQFKAQHVAQNATLATMRARIAELENAIRPLVREMDAGRMPIASDWAAARAALKINSKG